MRIKRVQSVEFVVEIPLFGFQLFDLDLYRGGIDGTHDDLAEVVVARDRLAGLVGFEQEREQFGGFGVFEVGITVKDHRVISAFERAGIGLAVEGVDEKVKNLLFGEFIGCLVRAHQPTKQPVHLTRFVRY